MQAFYKIPPNVTVSDLVVLVYGSLDLTMKLVVDNPFITDCNFDLTNYAGQLVEYDDELVQRTPTNLEVTPQAVPTEGVYVVQQGQSLSDVCLQVYGTLDYMTKLVVDNGFEGVNITADDLLGKSVIFNRTLTKNPALFNFNQNKKIVYATAFGNPDEVLPPGEEYKAFQDGVDFIFQDSQQYLFQ